MRGEEHASPVVTEAADEPEQPLDFALGERRGRLVEKEDARFAHEGGRDLDHLALRERERTRKRAGVDAVHSEALENLGRALSELPPLDQPRGAAWLAPDEEVLGHRQPGKERQLLEHGADAEPAGSPGTGGGHVLPVDHDRTGVRLHGSADDLDQRALAGAVLTDERVNLAEARRQRRPGERLDTAEGAGNADCFDCQVLRGRRGPCLVAHLGDCVESRSWLVVAREERATTSRLGDLLGKPDLQDPGARLACQRCLARR